MGFNLPWMNGNQAAPDGPATGSTDLPSMNTPWPPPQFRAVAGHHAIWAAWVAGDREQLAYVYQMIEGSSSLLGQQFFAGTGQARSGAARPWQARNGINGMRQDTFWGRNVPAGESLNRLHVPLAADMARTSANLLFGSELKLTSTLDGPQGVRNQEYFATLLDDSFMTRMLDAAEKASALGGVILQVVWDLDVSPRPWLEVVAADNAIPEFSYSKLRAVTFYEECGMTPQGDLIRHVEKHVPGQNAIMHAAYVGDDENLGRLVPLTEFPYLAGYADGLENGDTLYLPDMPNDASTVIYIPNRKPNWLWRGLGPDASQLGLSDYAGVENLMDALDEAYSSWMRDIRLGKGRMVVPQDYLRNLGKGEGAIFEEDRSIFVGLDAYADAEGSGGMKLTVSQFQIRWQEHQQTVQDLTNRIVQGAGYSPQSFGDYAGNAPTATEIKARERKSMTLREAKMQLWRPALADAIYSLMCMEVTQFGRTDITPERPTIEFGPIAQSDTIQLAATAAALEAANAASQQTVVAMVHPDWTEDQVNAELNLMAAERGVMLPKLPALEPEAPEPFSALVPRGERTVGEDVI